MGEGNVRPDYGSVEKRLEARVRRVQEAIRTASTQGLESARDFALYSSELAEAGRWDEAESAALSITDDPEERGETLADLATRMSRRGLVSRALGVLERIPDDSAFPGALEEKVIALVEVAKSAFAGGEHSEIDGLIETAFASLRSLGDQGGPWLEPQVMLETGRLFYARRNRRRAVEVWRSGADRAEQLLEVVDCQKILGRLGVELLEAGETHDAKRIETLLAGRYGTFEFDGPGEG